jgi:tRNA pseudouridine38-40 synthase
VLRVAASHLVGEHDFSAFGSATSVGGSTVRRVMLAEWTGIGDQLFFSVTANAFLYRMVRRLTYTQVLVGQGACSMEAFIQAIEQKKMLSTGLAEPQGLTLEEVGYMPTDKNLETQ